MKNTILRWCIIHMLNTLLPFACLVSAVFFYPQYGANLHFKHRMRPISNSLLTPIPEWKPNTNWLNKNMTRQMIILLLISLYLLSDKSSSNVSLLTNQNFLLGISMVPRLSFGTYRNILVTVCSWYGWCTGKSTTWYLGQFCIVSNVK